MIAVGRDPVFDRAAFPGNSAVRTTACCALPGNCREVWAEVLPTIIRPIRTNTTRFIPVVASKKITRLNSDIPLMKYQIRLHLTAD